jgi:hypothetical protein
MKLDSDEHLSLDKEILSLEFITENVRLSPVGTLLEKCLLVQETFFNIGDYSEKEFTNGIRVLANNSIWTSSVKK